MSLSDCFLQFQLTKENSRCADCSSQTVSHACISHGVFICETCSINHELLTAKISIIKPLANEFWSSYHTNLMLTGGNKRFRDFMTNFEYTSDCEIQEKYLSQPAAQYRKLLKSESEYRQVSGSAFYNEEPLENQDKVSWWSGAKDFLNNTVHKIVQIGTFAKEKVTDGEILASVKSKADQMLSKSKIFKDQVGEKMSKESINDLKNKSLEILDTLSSIAKDKVKTVYSTPFKQDETEMVEMGNFKS